MITESEILERIGEAIDDTDADQLASIHNYLTNYAPISSDDIELSPGWHLVPREGAH